MRLLLALAAVPLLALQSVSIRVDAASSRGPWRPVWAFFGYDEPNYTYAPHGKKLLRELADLSPVPVYIRAHNLLTSGDGTPALKWGSTNAYSEDSSGRPVYDWKILDQIFDAYREANLKPLVEIGFMPEALSTQPRPYQHAWFPGPGSPAISTGWAYPPRDYRKWAELSYQWVRHAVERYGQAEVESWYWELWNEPNILYWKGTPEEYHQLYDFTADAVKRALPRARIGGPHSTGPGADQAAQFLRAFLEHCLRGRNYATGQTGAPLDFIGFHAKGRPAVVDGHVRMGSSKHAQDVSRGLEIVASFPELRNKPIILGETDPEGCAACPASVFPQNAYRNGTLYSSYTAAILNVTYALADRHQSNLTGAVTWAFEFENQPYFAGFRSLATNGIDKPVLNVFRMLGLMAGDRLRAESTAAAPLDTFLRSGVPGEPDVNALATRRRDREISILVWNYHDDELPAPPADIQLQIENLPASAARLLLRHYRIDEHHSNAYTAWKRLGSPQRPTPEQYVQLESAGQLQLLGSPSWRRTEEGRLHLRFSLPRHAVSLVQASW